MRKVRPAGTQKRGMLCAHFSKDGLDAAHPVVSHFDGAWCASKRMQTMSGPATCLHGELFGQDLQDGIRHLHERMPGQVITGMIRNTTLARVPALRFPPTPPSLSGRASERAARYRTAACTEAAVCPNRIA